MKAFKLAAVAVLAFSGIQAAQAQTPVQSCKRNPRMASGQDIGPRRAPDGAMWYASANANRIVRVDEKFQETPFVPVDGTTKGLSGLALDDAGNIWFSKTEGRVGRFPMAGGEGVEYALPAQHSFPVGLVRGPDNAMWYYDPVQKNIGRVSKDGSITIIPQPPKLNPFYPSGMAVGIDNSLWITDMAQNALFKLDIASKSYKRYDIPEPTAHPQTIAVARDGTVWFAMTAVQKLGRFKNGVFTSVDINKERPEGLHIAEDQSLWYTTSSNTLGRIKPDGGRETYKCQNAYGGISTAADGTVWVLGNGSMLTLKPGDVSNAPKIASQGSVQGPGLMPLGPSPVRVVTLPELRKLFDDKTKKLVVHFTVPAKKGCGPCDESTAVFEEFARKNSGKATFVRLANEYSEAAWSDPWYKANAALAGLPTYITYYDQKEVARVAGRESVAVLDSKLLPVR